MHELDRSNYVIELSKTRKINSDLHLEKQGKYVVVYIITDKTKILTSTRLN